MMGDYDPQTCITAGELRAMGCELPPEIPNCGWVPRTALVLDSVLAPPIEEQRANRTLPSFRVTMKITEPWRWIEIKGTIDV